MTRFFFDLQLLSKARNEFYTLDGECEGQCIKEARAVVQTLGNAIVDHNPLEQFEVVGFVLRPWLKVISHA